MTASTLRVGTAGWSVAAQYNGDVPTGGSHLERYARRLNAVEINSSFYRPHQRKTYERWAQSTPRGFRFSLKVPKAMTHEYSLADCGALLDRFAADVTGLGVKLAVLLVQLPPNLALEKRVAGGFFRSLRKRIDVPIACEPRHASWFTPDTNDWLAGRGIARVAADPAKVPEGGEPGGWTGLAYYRWHGSPRIYYSDYDEKALTTLGRRLAAHRKRGIPTWCIFDNTASGAALGNALTMTTRPNRPIAVNPAAG
ncbi:MAG TPA: DUF72 domain-containing protein [Bradyrhizobium sp.]|jgi:uncharacterized protein YecE (DUF72 family)|nr:DUF72 domain-containing protein [Bradyrhizobium sp.]